MNTRTYNIPHTTCKFSIYTLENIATHSHTTYIPNTHTKQNIAKQAHTTYRIPHTCLVSQRLHSYLKSETVTINLPQAPPR